MPAPHRYDHTPSLRPISGPAVTRPAALKPFSDDDLLHAVQHHRRALAGLRGGTLVVLPPATTDKLIDFIQRDLGRLETELTRRGLDGHPEGNPVGSRHPDPGPCPSPQMHA